MSDIIRLETISDLNSMMGQDEPKHPLISIVDFSKLKHQQKEGVRITMGFYSIMEKNLCPGSFRYGRNIYDFQEGSLFFMGPNQVISIEGQEETEDIYGWGLFFHPELIRGTSLYPRMKSYSFFSYDLHEALHVSEKEKNKLANIVEDIEAELDQNIDKHSRTLIVSSLELLLNYCNRFYDRQFITRTESNKDIISEFSNILEGYFLSPELESLGYPSIKFFAEALHLSPNYLSDLLKKETGKNGTEHIQYHMIGLAKDKLLSSSASVSEIAYDLGFEYPQYFSKMFKKNTGMTPKEYRTGVN